LYAAAFLACGGDNTLGLGVLARYICQSVHIYRSVLHTQEDAAPSDVNLTMAYYDNSETCGGEPRTMTYSAYTFNIMSGIKVDVQPTFTPGPFLQYDVIEIDEGDQPTKQKCQATEVGCTWFWVFQVVIRCMVSASCKAAYKLYTS
jgi:hypothetical protein